MLIMVLLTLPFIRSIGIGGMLIPAVAVLASLTLLPAMLGWLGASINSARVIPRRWVEPHDPDTGFWGRWAATVARHPRVVFAAGLTIVVLVLIPAFKINPSDAVLKNEPASGDAQAGREAIAAAGLPQGLYLPYIVLAEKGATPAVLDRVASGLASTAGIAGASAPPT